MYNVVFIEFRKMVLESVVELDLSLMKRLKNIFDFIKNLGLNRM